MRLMLAVIVACVLLGLFSRTIGRREQRIVVGIAVLMTALYFSSIRFM